MTDETALRRQLVKLLTASEAHSDLDEVVDGFDVASRGVRPENGERSPWEILEHIRIALWDLLQVALDPQHESPDYPDGYWPRSPQPPDDASWENTINAIKNDMKTFADLLSDESRDLFAPFPGQEYQTVLRLALVAADHNAYHIGQLVTLQQLLCG